MEDGYLCSVGVTVGAGRGVIAANNAHLVLDLDGVGSSGHVDMVRVGAVALAHSGDGPFPGVMVITYSP